MIVKVDRFNHEAKKAGKLLFFIGLFSMTRINLGGSIAISELALVACAPFVLGRNINNFRRDGVFTLAILSLLWLVGAIISNTVNRTYIPFALKGVATPIVYFSSTLCCYYLLKKDVRNVKWFVLGVALSYILSTFIFQRAGSINDELNGEDALSATIGYKLYWIGLAAEVFLLPVKGWFLQCPILYCLASVGGMAGFSLLSGARSNFLCYAVSLVFIFIGKSVKTRLDFVRRHFILICLIMFSALFVIKKTYHYAAEQGMLGDDERRKYETQTNEGSSALHMIMAGRVEFFVCGYAACEAPLLGLGSWALDYNNVYIDFLSRYGSAEDYQRATKYLEKNNGVFKIPAHSHIMTFWMWHGILGLLFWVYVIFLIFKTFRHNMQVVPALFGYLSLTIPLFVWDVLFSPAGYRISESVLLVVCVLLGEISKQQRRNQVNFESY